MDNFSPDRDEDWSDWTNDQTWGANPDKKAASKYWTEQPKRSDDKLVAGKKPKTTKKGSSSYERTKTDDDWNEGADFFDQELSKSKNKKTASSKSQRVEEAPVGDLLDFGGGNDWDNETWADNDDDWESFEVDSRKRH